MNNGLGDKTDGMNLGEQRIICIISGRFSYHLEDSPSVAASTDGERTQSPAPASATSAPIVPSSDDSNKPARVGETGGPTSTAPTTSANESTDPNSVSTSDPVTAQEPLDMTTTLAPAPQSDLSKDPEPRASTATDVASNSRQPTPPASATLLEIPTDICPAWAKPALESFMEISAGENWKALLVSWITFEVEVGVDGVSYYPLCCFVLMNLYTETPNERPPGGNRMVDETQTPSDRHTRHRCWRIRYPVASLVDCDTAWMAYVGCGVAFPSSYPC